MTVQWNYERTFFHSTRPTPVFGSDSNNMQAQVRHTPYQTIIPPNQNGSVGDIK